MNVNFPNVAAPEVTGVQVVRQGRRAAGIEIVPIKDPLGRPYLWIGDFLNDDAVSPGTDLAATRAGAISVTPLHLDLTHGATLAKLKKALT
jgi:5'-nucleotidase